MSKLIITVVLVFCVTNLYSQDVEIIRAGNIKLPKVKWKENFPLIEKSIDTTSLTFIATYKVSGKINKLNIIDHFYLIHEKAKKIGANAYTLDYYYSDTANNIATTIMSTYFVSNAVLIQNDKLKPKNIIYIFGDDKIFLKNKTTSFEVNGVVKEIKNTTEYFKYQLKNGEKVILSKGDAIGPIMTIDGEKDRSALYFRVSGFNAGVQPVPMGVTFNSGQIHPTDKNLSEFLSLILKSIE